MIKLINIKKSFNIGKNNEINVLKNINLHVLKGEMVAIKGSSGVGKSTLLNILGCISKPTSGNYLLDGKDITLMSPAKLASIRNTKLGFVMQDFTLIEDETVNENIMIPVYFSKNNTRSAKRRADALMRELDISSVSSKTVFKLSGGEKQRVAIARAMINSPDIILADEPTGSLDTDNSNNVMDIFRSLNNKGCTMVIVTHDDEVAQKCSRAVSLSEGMIIEQDGGFVDKT